MSPVGSSRTFLPLVQRLANILAFERRCIRSSFVAQVRRTLPVRLHLRALLARRIDALDATGYLRDATLALLATILFAGAAGCSRAGDGSIAVQLVYPSPPAPAAASRPSVREPSYATDPTDRIRIRVLAPHFAPIERWFLRSEGRGEIGGIPPGSRITVEVDEYDNTAIPSDSAVVAAPLLGRGWFNGITLSAGEVETVPVAMYAKGTIVTICGAPASGGSGTSGDTGDGGLDNAALLGNPTAVKVGPDDSIYVSSSAFRKVKRIDRYGYLSVFAGDGTHGTITPGTPAASAPIGAVQDIDIDPAGNLYLFNDFNQIVRIDNGVVNKLVYDNGVENSVATVQPRRRRTSIYVYLRELPRPAGLSDDRDVEIRLRDG